MALLVFAAQMQQLGLGWKTSTLKFEGLANDYRYIYQFFDPRWLARLALLTDITAHLNAINVKLQGKDILVTDMHAHITAYDVGKPGIVGCPIG